MACLQYYCGVCRDTAGAGDISEYWGTVAGNIHDDDDGYCCYQPWGCRYTQTGPAISGIKESSLSRERRLAFLTWRKKMKIYLITSHVEMSTPMCWVRMHYTQLEKIFKTIFRPFLCLGGGGYSASF